MTLYTCIAYNITTASSCYTTGVLYYKYTVRYAILDHATFINGLTSIPRP